MFENYRELSADEQARIKAIHLAIRSDRSFGDRYRILAWGYIRGFKFRRMERTHHTQDMGHAHHACFAHPTCLALPCRSPTSPDLGGNVYEHNLPSALVLAKLLAKHIPEFKDDLAAHLATPWGVKGSRIEAWLQDPSGAVPAPAPRPKRPYEPVMRASA